MVALAEIERIMKGIDKINLTNKAMINKRIMLCG
jgi:hypothetical protein